MVVSFPPLACQRLDCLASTLVESSCLLHQAELRAFLRSYVWWCLARHRNDDHIFCYSTSIGSAHNRFLYLALAGRSTSELSRSLSIPHGCTVYSTYCTVLRICIFGFGFSRNTPYLLNVSFCSYVRRADRLSGTVQVWGKRIPPFQRPQKKIRFRSTGSGSTLLVDTAGRPAHTVAYCMLLMSPEAKNNHVEKHTYKKAIPFFFSQAKSDIEKTTSPRTLAHSLSLSLSLGNHFYSRTLVFSVYCIDWPYLQRSSACRCCCR